MDLNQILTIIFTGVATGIGTSVGSYLAAEHLIRKFKMVKEVVKNGKKKD